MQCRNQNSSAVVLVANLLVLWALYLMTVLDTASRLDVAVELQTCFRMRSADGIHGFLSSLLSVTSASEPMEVIRDGIPSLLVWTVSREGFLQSHLFLHWSLPASSHHRTRLCMHKPLLGFLEFWKLPSHVIYGFGVVCTKHVSSLGVLHGSSADEFLWGTFSRDA